MHQGIVHHDFSNLWIVSQLNIGCDFEGSFINGWKEKAQPKPNKTPNEQAERNDPPLPAWLF
jgi:hypothetical protein